MMMLVPVRISLLLLVVTILSGRPSAAELTGHPLDGRSPVEVRVQMVLLDLDRIRGAEQSFTANLAYVARWSDPRLRHEHPGEITRPLSGIWHPRLQIVNRQRIQTTFPDEARISPEGEVVSVQRVWGEFSQPLVLHDFPFDLQDLRVELVATGHENGSVILRPDSEHSSFVSETLAISDWKVIDWGVEAIDLTIGGDAPRLPAIVLKVSCERNHRFHLVNVILPLVMIICMSWVVFWINPKNANPRISVSVTAMLTLIAYRFAVSASLPKIGYLTRMDWFILGSSILVFLALLEVVATSWLSDHDRLEAGCKLNYVMRIIAPVAFAIIAYGSLS